MSPSQWITLFVIFYSHLLAPKLPGPVETFLQNPLIKILGLFWLVYERTRNWKFSLLISSGVISIFEGVSYWVHGRETFCGSHRQGSSKSDRIAQFLDNTDNFIKHLYNYLEVESADAIEYAPEENQIQVNHKDQF